MINLTFQRAHRSILDLPATALPDFTVLTGVNGSGKTHLVDSIKAGAIKVEGVDATEADIRLFNWNTFIPGKNSPSDPIQIAKERTGFINGIVKRFNQLRLELMSNITKQKLSSISLENLDSVLLMNEAGFTKLQKEIGSVQINMWLIFEKMKMRFQQACLSSFDNNQVIKEALEKRANQQQCHISSLSIQDIDGSIPLNWTPTDVFQQNISRVFAVYHKAFDDNQYNQYKHHQKGESNNCLSDAQFFDRYGAKPWDLVNRLLEKAHLDYSITYPLGRAEQPFEAKLINKISKAQVSFQDLSSGEQIIMSFALCLYNVTDKKTLVRYPKLLLFDEIDAPLHPSMTKDIIGIIDKVLVREKGLKVILTTHSPSTVAFSPEGSLHRLDKQPRALVPCTRDQAVQALTNGYISVMESSRFVITEAKFDRIIYTAIFRKLVDRSIVPSTPNLVFIQATDKKNHDGGGCSQVREWGTKLPVAGLKNILGLIDRDAGNKETAFVKVLRRYSIENYLIDPIMLYAVLMHRNEHLKVFDCGIKDANYFELKTVDHATLQEVANRVCAAIEKHQPSVTAIPGSTTIKYLNGITISVPQWLVDYRGHDLITHVRETFRNIVAKDFIVTQNDCEDLLNMLTERLPDFMPTDLLQIFMDLQTA